MTKEEKSYINEYIIVFKNHIAPYLKDNVSIRSIVYPFENGAILVFNFDFNGSGNTEYRSESETLESAAEKAGIADAKMDIVIFARNTITEIKPFKKEAWSPTIADDVIGRLFNAIKSKLPNE